MSVELTEKLLSDAAGWAVVKHARAYLQQGQVLSSYWAPPLLRGVVQTGELSFRASLVLKSHIDIENLCTCRDAREWGKICAHAVAVGLHWIQAQKSAPAPERSAIPNRAQAVNEVARKSSGLHRSAGGEPAELFIILPPDIEQAISRGKIMLVLESKWGGGPCPINALPKAQVFSFSEQDNRILDAIEVLARGEVPAILQLDLHQFESLLPELVGQPNISLGKSSAVTITRMPFNVPMRATLEANGEILLSPLATTAKRLLTVGNWTYQNKCFQPLGCSHFTAGVLQNPIRIPREKVPQFVGQELPPMLASGSADANFKIEDFVLAPQPPRFLLELRGGLAQLTALLQCAYGKRIMTVGVTSPNEPVWLPDPEIPTRYGTRDLNAERAALIRLQMCGFTGTAEKLQLLGQNAVLNFFAREFPKLQREWTVNLEERLERSTRQNLERIEPRFQISSGIQWFDLGVVFASSDGQSFSPAEIQRLILSGQSHTRLKSGKFAVIDTGAVEELQEVLLDCAPQQHAQGYRISNNQAAFVEATLKQHPNWAVQAEGSWRDRAARQSGEASLAPPPLGNLEAVLRPYQKHGVAWLRFLRENGFGGILADEMGLGKTLQTLAFLRFVRENTPGGPPMLVVCPTSLVSNWSAEARKFTPELKVLALHGPDRHSRFTEIPRVDLVVTSYALIRRDSEQYRRIEFDTLVLDEAQHIKNRQTQNAQAVKSIRSKNRLVLTGTPLENSVLDLWSIFDFLMPAYLGNAQDFRERYELPITRDKDPQAQSRLARRLRPFLLRRLKKEVAPDLPARLEQVSFCELTAGQRSAYQQLIEASRKEILDTVGAQGLAKSRMLVLNALLRLRQICCDLRLLNLQTRETSTSGKLELFGELLEEVIDGGHRLLVFSQFVSMLTLLKEKLAAENIDYCYLDGATQNRAAVVERFQNDSSIPVFLISLKAGGVGLNLTGADTVIHFDPWWNPAVEDQATDRAHRIGQSRVVTSYKLITRDTVEEKILALQNRKREVINAMIGGEEEFASSLNWEEIQELLR